MTASGALREQRASAKTVLAPGRHRLPVLLVAILVLAGLLALSVLVGSQDIAPSVVWDALFAPAPDPEQYTIRDLRVPRTIVGLTVGAALGMSGALIQALTRNPLAEPGILGVHAGATFAVAFAVGVLGFRDIGGYLWFAFAGALVVTVLVLLLGATNRGRSQVLMVLAGVSVGAVFTGATSALTLVDPDAFDELRGWQAGSIVGRPLELLWPILPAFGLALLLAVAAANALNAMALGDDLARSQGARLARTRVLTVAAITLLAGGATAIAGPIGFIGLMIPHIARWIVGPNHRWILLYSIVLAPSLLLLSDIVGRIVMLPGEIPVGIVTAFVGAPVLITLVRRRRASGL